MNLGTENEKQEFKLGTGQLDKGLKSLSAMLNRGFEGTVYSLFAQLSGTMNNDCVMECLGFVGNDKNLRVYSLVDDTSLNYIMVLRINGDTESPDFYRAMDTWNEDILTPSYIEPLGIESWGSAGIIHYEE